MHKDVLRSTPTANGGGVPQPASLRWARRKSISRIVLVVAFTLPAAQIAHSSEIYFARAIGHEFLPEPQPKAAPAAKPQAAPELPGLGTAAEAEADTSENSGKMGTWSKVLVGVLVVGAIAALGSNGGGGEASVGTGGADSGSGSGGGSPPPPPSSGGGIGIGIGGGGIGTGGGDRNSRR